MAQMLIRPPDSLKESLQKEARRKGMSLNALVLQILWEWLDRNRGIPGGKS